MLPGQKPEPGRRGQAPALRYTPTVIAPRGRSWGAVLNLPTWEFRKGGEHLSRKENENFVILSKKVLDNWQSRWYHIQACAGKLCM